MAAKKKGTIERAQDALLRAMRDFEKAVSGMMGSPAPAKAKKAKKKTAKRKTKARKGARKAK